MQQKKKKRPQVLIFKTVVLQIYMFCFSYILSIDFKFMHQSNVSVVDYQ